MKNLILVPILLLCLMVSLPIAAEASTSNHIELAQAEFDQGAVDYMAKRYGEAAVRFRKAYTYVPEATFLYNQAKALDRLGNYESALLALNKAMAQKKLPLPTKLQEKSVAFKADLEAKLAKSTKAKKKAHEASLTENDDLSALGWVGVGVGVVGSGLVVWSALVASNVSNDNEELLKERDRNQFDAKRQEVVDNQSRANVLLFSGVGLMVVGAGMLAWDLIESEEGESISFEVIPGLEHGYAGVRGSW